MESQLCEKSIFSWHKKATKEALFLSVEKKVFAQLLGMDSRK
jgi:hypothetical protein